MPRPLPTTIPQMYDYSVLLSHRKKLPPDLPRPHLTQDWPPENIALLECYCQWLKDGGVSPLTIRILHIPMAGHVLGLALKPHPQLDVDADFQRALDYIKAKRLSTAWEKNCSNALLVFRRFFRLQRGLGEELPKPASFSPDTSGLPAWLVEEISNLLRLRMRNWRPARLEDGIKRFWSGHLRLWRFLVGQCGVRQLSDLRRQHIFAFIAHQQDTHLSSATINSDLREWRTLLHFLEDQGYRVPQSLLRIPDVIPPDRLPKFLTDDQVRLLRGEIERRVKESGAAHHLRMALLTRAAFYLLWQSGLRLGEVEELRLEDLDLPGRKLSVRQGKNLKDRTVFFTDTTVNALKAYLVVRGQASSDHVFTFRNRALHKDLLRAQLQVAGKAVGVKVYPHRLRHTCATQLLNAGCKVTSIQKFLGHKKLSSTMIYARVHDQTVADDYYGAMSRVEQRLELVDEKGPAKMQDANFKHLQLISLADELITPELSYEMRCNIASRIRSLVVGLNSFIIDLRSNESTQELWIPPPQIAFGKTAEM
jgi:site-specific recombinase XerD